MILRFFHADRGVGAAVLEAVRSSPRLMLVTQLKGPRDLTFDTRTPFREILATAGDQLDVVAIIDEGKPEGMWRDPMGDLCDALFCDSHDAAGATSGYVLAQGGRGLGWFRKALWDPLEDAETITAELAERLPGLRPFVRPPPAAPGAPRREGEPRPPRPRRTRTPVINPAADAHHARTQEMPAAGPLGDDDRTPVPPRSSRLDDDDPTPVPPKPPRFEDDEPTPVPPKAAPPPQMPPEPPPIDPYKILGLTPGVSFDEARKVWRSLLVQYHPDKVAHLAPEFQKLAEEKTREINSAWTLLESTLRGS